jgi:hypothetical protein
MKLPKLNGLIRAAENAKIAFRVGPAGTVIHINVQKSSLLEQLAEAFPDKGETGLTLNSEGFLTSE